MKEHEVIILLKKFSRKEISEFRKFLRSPFDQDVYNKNILKLFDLIAKYHPYFTHNNLEKKILYKSIYGDKVYNDDRIRELFSYLRHSIYGFVVHKNIKNDKVKYNDILLSELFKYDVPLLVNKLINEQCQILKEHGFDAKLMREMLKLCVYKYNYKVLYGKLLKKKDIIKQEVLLGHFNSILITNFIIELTTNYLGYVEISDKFRMKKIIEKEKQRIKKLNLDNLYKSLKLNTELNFVIKLYISMLNMFLFPKDIKRYKKYKMMFYRYSKKLHINEKKFHLSKLIYFCILKIKSSNGDPLFRKGLLSYYEYMLKHKLHIEENSGKMTIELYINIFHEILKLYDEIKIKRFIEKYAYNVSDIYKETVLHYSYAMYNFYVHNFKNSLEHIKNISYNHAILKFDINILKIKIFYELNFVEQCYDLIHSYRELIRHNEYLDKNVVMQHKEFLKSMIKLLSIKENKGLYESGLEHFKLLRRNDVIQKEWLLEKLCEFSTRAIRH